MPQRKPTPQHKPMPQRKPTPTLREILSNETSLDISDIRAHLDALPGEQRLKQCMKLGKKHQRRLFELAADSEPVTLNDFVPDDVPDGTEVTHQGRNTLPIFRRFQKPMMRAPELDGLLCGYNAGITRPFIGPGYFVAHPTAGHKDWESRGSIVVNYFKTPPVDIDKPDHWPSIKPNSKGLQKFVYRGTRDFMRKVSSHVTIGEAYRGEESMESWFILFREAPSTPSSS